MSRRKYVLFIYWSKICPSKICPSKICPSIKCPGAQPRDRLCIQVLYNKVGLRKAPQESWLSFTFLQSYKSLKLFFVSHSCARARHTQIPTLRFFMLFLSIVTKIGQFWKFLRTKLLEKLAQIISNIYRILWKMALSMFNCSAYFWATFGEYKSYFLLQHLVTLFLSPTLPNLFSWTSSLFEFTILFTIFSWQAAVYNGPLSLLRLPWSRIFHYLMKRR